MFSYDSHPYFGSHNFKDRSILSLDLNGVLHHRVIGFAWCNTCIAKPLC